MGPGVHLSNLSNYLLNITGRSIKWLTPLNEPVIVGAEKVSGNIMKSLMLIYTKSNIWALCLFAESQENILCAHYDLESFLSRLGLDMGVRTGGQSAKCLVERARRCPRSILMSSWRARNEEVAMRDNYRGHARDRWRPNGAYLAFQIPLSH